MIEEININFIPFDSLKQIVIPKEDDPQLYDGYVLNVKQLREINKHLTKKIVANFKLYFYVLESAGVYDCEVSNLPHYP
jgi:hypothetical protein